MSDIDPFPRDRFTATIRRMPRYAKLAWRLGRDPLISRARRAAVIAAAGYLVSPIDAVPGVIPVLGQLDDIAVVLAALRFAMAGLDSARRREHLDAVGLADGDLAEDLRTVGVTTAWTLRAGGRTTGRLLRGSASVAGKAAGTAAGTARRSVPSVTTRVGSAMSTAGGAVAKGGSAARVRVSRLPIRRRRGLEGLRSQGSGI